MADETAPLKWQGLPPAGVLYCASKVLGEGLGRLYRDQHGVELVSLDVPRLGERLRTRGARCSGSWKFIKASDKPGPCR